jgi:hypothetical protein
MQLPNGWLWDMIDEFIYQFQASSGLHGCESDEECPLTAEWLSILHGAS